MTQSWTCEWEAWASLWAATLLHFFWQGIAVTFAHRACLLVLSRSAAQWRYLCGVGWLCVLAVCPTATCSLLALRPTESLPFTSPSPFAASPVDMASFTPAPLDSLDGEVSMGALQSAPWRPRLRWGSTDWQWWVVGGWCLGVSVLSLRLLGGGCAVIWLRQQAKALPPDLMEPVQRLGRRLKVSSDVIVAVSDRITTAIACGLWRPMVLVPASWLMELSPAMLQAVIAHELAHIRRYDLWVNLFQRVTETLWFYHPAVWWISSSIRRERETACDELAVSVLPSRVHYAETLEFLAKSRFAGAAPLWLSTGMGGKRMALLQRIHHVLETKAPRTATAVWPTVCMVILLTAGTAVVVRSAAWAAPQDPRSEEFDATTVEGESREDATQRRNELRAVRLELRQAQRQLREYEEVIRDLQQELDATRARFPRQQERDRVEAITRQREAERRRQREIESMSPFREGIEAARAAEQVSEPREGDEPRDTGDPRRRQRDRDRDPEAVAMLEFEQQMLQHRQESIEMQMQQARERFEKELYLRRNELKSAIDRRKQQLELEQQMAVLELKHQELQHKRQVREVVRRIEGIEQRMKVTKDDFKRDELLRELSMLQDEQEMLKAEQVLARARRELEVRAKQVDVESELESAMKKTEIEAELRLQAELRDLEMARRELEMERRRLQLELEAGRGDRDRKGR